MLIALGSNLPGPFGATPRLACEAAIARLAALPGLRMIARSAWYRTRPEPPMPGVPSFVNGVVRLGGSVPDAEALLAAMLAVEAAAGRARPYPNAPRSLDLDLLAVGDLVMATPTLTLPHPRLHQRGFVLRPLVDVAPDWRHPVLGRTAAELLASLPPDEDPPRRLESVEA